jgi:RNA polymerase sigma-70 factor, ECF subfamily
MRAHQQPQPNATEDARAHELRLVQRLVSGCDVSWREFVCQYAAVLRSRVQRVAVACGAASDSQSVDDCVAEVFGALLSNDHAALRAYAGRSSLVTYLCVIAARVTIRSALAQKHTTSVANIESQFDIQDQRAADPIQHAMSEEQRLRLRETINGLPPKQRDLVAMFYLQGKSYREISQKLSMPVGSIGPSLKRAEEKLRSLLGPSP